MTAVQPNPQFRVANLETTGSDQVTVKNNLNAHGAQGMEHYSKLAGLGYFRHTDFIWEYSVITIYGPSRTQTERINALAVEGWMHYWQEGTQGYFKRAKGQIAPPPEVKAEEVPAEPIIDDRTDRAGIRQMEVRPSEKNTQPKGRHHGRSARR